MLSLIMKAGTVVAAVALAMLTTVPARAADEASVVQGAQNGITLGVGKATLVNLPRPIIDVFIANDKIANVRVASATQINVFGTGAGETTLYATDKAGKVVYSANVRVAQNIDSINGMLGLAMPGSAVTVTPMNGLVLLTGTVASPGDVEEVSRLVTAFVGDKQAIINKLRSATPVQVNLQVKIAEVSRELLKQFGVNLLSRDTTNGFQFGVSRGRNFGSIGTPDLAGFPQLDASNLFGLPANSLKLPFDPRTGQFLFGGTAFNFTPAGGAATALNFAGKLAGIDLASALDVLEQDGVVTMLAEPNLTALSGETASFLAGGEFPIAVSTGLGQTTVEFKQYGVGLSFTPTVVDGNRITIRVRPEVSELSDAGAIKLNNISIPALTTRRAETTVELGSGQSFMIAGLLKNGTRTASDKTPVLGDLPILGALFKSDRFQRNETELVIVVTPYLVKPMNPDQVRLPTDGYQAPTDLQRWLLGKTFSGKSAKTADAGSKPKATPAPGFSVN